MPPIASRPAPQVSYEELMRPHLEQTRGAMREQERVLLIQDTSRA